LKPGDNKAKEWVHKRKDIDDLSPKEVESIVDCNIRKCVEAKLKELGKSKPKEAFKDKENHPKLRTRKGNEIPIHRVRIRTSDKTWTIAPAPGMPDNRGPRTREVMTDKNHHMEIIETTNANGKKKWEGRVVSTYTAMRRVKEGSRVIKVNEKRVKVGGPIVEKADGFKFSLAPGDIVELNDKKTKGQAIKGEQPARQLYLIRSVWESEGLARVAFTHINDARKKSEQGKRVSGMEQTSTVDKLCDPEERNCRKVIITPLGEIRTAND
jgi:hypothetical protein